MKLKSIFKVNSQVKYVHVQRRSFREGQDNVEYITQFYEK
jgi:hypothetical protein